MTSVNQSHRSSPLFVAGALVITAALVAAGLWVARYVDSQEVVPPGQPGEATATPVCVVMVERRPLVVEAEFHGFLVPFEELTTSAEVAGEIMEQRVEVSDPVGAGQLLFKIDDAVRETAHEQALATLDRARSDTRLAEANWKRIQGLDDEQASPTERQEGETRYLTAKANERHAEAAVRQSSLLLARTNVWSPIDGVVSRLHSRKGEFTQPGLPLADVIEVDRLKLLGEIEDREVVWVRVGLPVVLTTEIFPGERFQGRVHRIYPQALPTSRKFEIEIELPNTAGRLRPGFFLKGIIAKPNGGDDDESPAEVLVVPREAIVKLFGQHFAHVVRPRGSATNAGHSTFVATRTTVAVLPIPSDPRIFEIVEGVEEGDLVVTKGIQHLSEQSLVRITD